MPIACGCAGASLDTDPFNKIHEKGIWKLLHALLPFECVYTIYIRRPGHLSINNHFALSRRWPLYTGSTVSCHMYHSNSNVLFFKVIPAGESDLPTLMNMILAARRLTNESCEFRKLLLRFVSIGDCRNKMAVSYSEKKQNLEVELKKNLWTENLCLNSIIITDNIRGCFINVYDV